MEAVNQEQNIQDSSQVGLKISLEWVAYALLILVALALRLASLGDVPMTDVEATQALSAYHSMDVNAVGNPQAASSPVLYWLQLASFSIFGGSEFASRLPIALAGVVLLLMPLLFREKFGAEKTFLFSLILSFSPVALTASRLADPVIFTGIFVLAFFWALWRYWDSRKALDAYLTTGVLAALLFLGESGGILLALVMLGAAVLTVVWQIAAAPYETESVGDEVLVSLRKFWSDFPVLPALGSAFAVVVLFSTGFMLNPSALNTVTELLNATLRGFAQPSIADAPPVFALLSLFVYEPVLVILGVIAAVTILSSRPTWLDRFAALWALLAFLVLLVYQGSKPAFALWIVLPLAYLVMRLVSNLLVNYMPSLVSVDSYSSRDANDYAWIKWTVACIFLFGLMMFSLNMAELGRAFRDYPGNVLVFDSQQHNIVMFGRMGWFLVMTLLLIVGFFLLASFWGNRNVLQGYGLGAFIFMLIIGAGTGWNTSVMHVSNPAELWHTSAVLPDAYELRTTLYEVAKRDTAGFPEIPITILLNPEAGVSDDGLIAWLLRDFEQTRFVTTLGDAAQDEIILLPIINTDPDLGGSYVGQSFAIRSHGTEGYMSAFDWLSWYTQRSIRAYAVESDVTVLWLRLDVYDGTPVELRPEG